MHIQNIAGAALFYHVDTYSNTTGLHDLKTGSSYMLNAYLAD
jgi:hypothetical protein